MADGMLPVIDTEVPFDDVATALKRMETRQVFGKIIVHF
jgi:alcohol dehydrogenase